MEMIVSVKKGDKGKVFDCKGNQIPGSLISCDLETGETVQFILDENGYQQKHPEIPNKMRTETIFLENLPLRFERD